MPRRPSIAKVIENAQAMQAAGFPVTVVEIGGVKYHIGAHPDALTQDPALRKLLQQAEASHEDHRANPIRRRV